MTDRLSQSSQVVVGFLREDAGNAQPSVANASHSRLLLNETASCSVLRSMPDAWKEMQEFSLFRPPLGRGAEDAEGKNPLRLNYFAAFMPICSAAKAHSSASSA